jgi:hypothetical protein
MFNFHFVATRYHDIYYIALYVVHEVENFVDNCRDKYNDAIRKQNTLNYASLNVN